MSSIEAIGKKGEKNILRDMFRDSDDNSSISEFSSHCDDEIDCNKLDEMNGDITLLASNMLSNDQTVELTSIDMVTYTSPHSHITIHLHQDKRKGIAHQLWPAASFLCDYVDTNLDAILSICGCHDNNHPIIIIELGAGIGLCGIFMKKLLSSRINRLYLTDLPEAMALLHENITQNFTNLENDTSHDIDTSHEKEKVSANVLRWGAVEDYTSLTSHETFHIHEISSYSIIIAADCVYWEHLYEPFVDVLSYYANQGYHILLSYVRRWKKDQKFFKLCKKRKLVVDTIYEVVDTQINEHTSVSSRRVMRIYHIYCQR